MSFKGKNIKKGKYVSKIKQVNPIRTKTPLKSVTKAKINSQKLEKQFNQSTNHEEKRSIKRKVVLAANRADKKGKKWGISKEKKKEYEKIARIYRSAYQRMVLEEIWSKSEQPAIYI